MTSEGHPYAVFKRALARRNASAAWAAAAMLPTVALADALALCLVTAEGAPARFERACGRWLARYVEEEPRLDLSELRLTAELICFVCSERDRARAAFRLTHGSHRDIRARRHTRRHPRRPAPTTRP
jgi:hypothetical protein